MELEPLIFWAAKPASSRLLDGARSRPSGRCRSRRSRGRPGAGRCPGSGRSSACRGRAAGCRPRPCPSSSGSALEHRALAGDELVERERAGADAVGLQVDARWRPRWATRCSRSSPPAGRGRPRWGGQVEHDRQALGAVGHVHRLDDAHVVAWHGQAVAGSFRRSKCLTTASALSGVSSWNVHALAQGRSCTASSVVVALDRLGEEGHDLAVDVGRERVVDAQRDDLVGGLGGLARVRAWPRRTRCRR